MTRKDVASKVSELQALNCGLSGLTAGALSGDGTEKADLLRIYPGHVTAEVNGQKRRDDILNALDNADTLRILVVKPQS